MIICGDTLTELRKLPDESIHCCVTSPPYWGLRNYGIEGQLGLERTPEEYVSKLVEVFGEVRRVLRKDGTLWLNLGDSYANDGKWGASTGGKHAAGLHGEPIGRAKRATGLKPKDLCGIPWRVAFAMQANGWWLRQDIIWHKPNPMPESVRDRCTKAHEYIFMLSKSARYWYDAKAISEPPSQKSIDRLSQPNLENQTGSLRVPGKINGPMKACFGGRKKATGYGTRKHSGREDEGNYIYNGVNRRSVWTITTKPFKEAHFATFPPEIPELCIKAGCPLGGIVFDPFFGAGTTGLVAKQLGRSFIGIELNEEYCRMAKRRIALVDYQPILEMEGKP